MIEVVIDENNKEIYEINKEISRNKKAILRRKQKNRTSRPLFSRLNDLKNSKTDL